METLLIKLDSQKDAQKLKQLAVELGLQTESIDTALIEAWEDFRLGQAIRQAEDLPLVSKAEVLKALSL